MLLRLFVALAVILSSESLLADGTTQMGDGWLERREGQAILHLSGAPYERGYQHGWLMKEAIERNVSRYLDQPGADTIPVVAQFKQQYAKVMTFVPPELVYEMRGIAEGSGIPFEKIALLNLFPEMFHCLGYTVTGPWTSDQQLYHMRVLEYAAAQGVQETAVLQVVTPSEGLPYVSVSYAGFIGVITGMNNAQIAIGEVGGKGYGQWNGMPMAFLLRQTLQYSSTLEEAKERLANTPRTCEYYYVLSDGKANSSCGVYATASQIHFIDPGTQYGLLMPGPAPQNYGENGRDDKFFFSPLKSICSKYQTVLYDAQDLLLGMIQQQPENSVIIIGGCRPERYPLLVERLEQQKGRLDATALQQTIKSPIVNADDLQNTIFCPSRLQLWVAHAGPNGEAACDQPYQVYSLQELLKASDNPCANK